MSNMTQVLKFSLAAKCPVGGRAIHPDHGWCEIAAVDGFNRTVIYEKHEEGNDAPMAYKAVVDVRNLREINPCKDFTERSIATVSELPKIHSKNA